MPRLLRNRLICRVSFRYLQERAKQCQDEKNSLHAQLSKMKVSSDCCFQTRSLQVKSASFSGAVELSKVPRTGSESWIDPQLGPRFLPQTDPAIFEERFRRLRGGSAGDLFRSSGNRQRQELGSATSQEHKQVRSLFSLVFVASSMRSFQDPRKENRGSGAEIKDFGSRRTLG